MGGHDHDAERFIRVDRSIMLSMLNAVFGPEPDCWLFERDLTSALLQLPRPIYTDHFRRDAAYLAQRGLIESRNMDHPYTNKRGTHWRLTAKGELFCRRGMPWDTIERLD